MNREKQSISFTKMHGCKNDYIYIDCTKKLIENPPLVARKLSDRRTGIGGDGIILILPSTVADFRMRIFNADGSEAEMCGNGVRCVGKYVYDFGLTSKKTVLIETGTHDYGVQGENILKNIKVLELNIEDEKVSSAVVDMGKPVLEAAAIPTTLTTPQVINYPLEIQGRLYPITCVNMGNPHAVTFLDEVKSLDLEKIGPDFEHHKLFPNRTNTEFIKVINPSEIEMRVWERGSGETFACGTGACAAAFAGILNGLLEDRVLVHLLGGDLIITYDRNTEHIFMEGPAVTVFSGSVEL